MLALRDLPNALTLGRMLLVAPLVYLLLTGAYGAALVVALIVGLSDWLDGALARRFGWQSEFGGMLDPHACFLLARGLKTLALRVRQQCRSAGALARAIAESPQVARVNYPGLVDHRPGLVDEPRNGVLLPAEVRHPP